MRALAKHQLDPYVPRDVLARLRGLELSPRKLVEGRSSGRYRSPRQGNALEFSGHRQYVQGDDARRFDWRLYCRTRRWYVREYHLESNYSAHVLIDAGASMLYPKAKGSPWRAPGERGPSKLLHAARMAVVLAHLVTRHNDMVGLAVGRQGWDPALDVRPSNARSQALRFIRLFEHLEPAGRTDLGKSILQVIERTDRHALFFVLTDGAGELGLLSKALQRARASDHELVLFHLLHRDELDFPFLGPAHFEGYDGGAGLTLDASDVRARYQELLRNFCAGLRTTCERNAAEYVRVDTSQPIDQVLVQFLARRRALGRG